MRAGFALAAVLAAAVTIQIVAAQSNSSSPDPLTSALNTLNSLLNLPKAIFEALYNALAGFLGNTGKGAVETASTAGDAVLRMTSAPITKPLGDAEAFLSQLTFTTAQLGFLLALLFYILPLPESEQWAAKGRRGMIDALLAVVLAGAEPVVLGLFGDLADRLSAAILSGVIPGLAQTILSNLASLANPASWFFLILGALTMLVAFALIAAIIALSFFTPVFWLSATACYALPIPQFKQAANQLFAWALIVVFLKPVGYGLIALYFYFQALLNPLSASLLPFVYLIFLYLFLKIVFSVARSAASSIPVLTSASGAVSTILYMSAFTFAARPVLGTSYYLSRRLHPRPPPRKKNAKGGDSNE